MGLLADKQLLEVRGPRTSKRFPRSAAVENPNKDRVGEPAGALEVIAPSSDSISLANRVNADRESNDLQFGQGKNVHKYALPVCFPRTCWLAQAFRPKKLGPRYSAFQDLLHRQTPQPQSFRPGCLGSPPASTARIPSMFPPKPKQDQRQSSRQEGHHACSNS